MDIIRWFRRWAIWLFLIGIAAGDCEASENEIITRAPFFAFGSMFLTAAASCGYLMISGDYDIRILAGIALGALVAYLALGLLRFFVERTDCSPTPWYTDRGW